MKRKLLPAAAGIILRILICYLVGYMAETAITYSAMRGAVLVRAFIMLIAVAGMLYFDHVMIPDKIEVNITQLIFDMLVNVAGAVISIVCIELYAREILALSVVVAIITFVLIVVSEKGIYFKCSRLPDEEFDDEDVEDSDIEGLDTEGLDTEDSEEETENANEEKDNKRTHNIMVQALGVASELALIIFVMLTLGDVYGGRYNGLYYLFIVILSILSAGVDSVYKSFREMYDKDVVRKAELIGYSVLSVLLSVFMCHRSILIGLIFLLGAFLVMAIIPLIFTNWGKGGTEVVYQNIDIFSRLVSRIMFVIIISVAVWQLSYGAIWEIDFLVIIAICFASIRYMHRMNDFDKALKMLEEKKKLDELYDDELDEDAIGEEKEETNVEKLDKILGEVREEMAERKRGR